MSRHARDWAWALQITPPQKLVTLALAERADDSGDCWPSLTHLTAKTGLARSTVALALNGLEAARLIVRDRGGCGRSTRYRLLMDRPRNPHGDSPGDGRVRESAVRHTDQASPADRPGGPADGLATVRETDPNRQLNRHRTASEPSLSSDADARPPKRTSAGRGKATPIPSDWRPSERVFDWAAKQGMTREWVQAQVDEFLVYWSDTAERRKSWDATFINRLQALQANQAKSQNHEPEIRLADKDYREGATPLDQIPWIRPATVG